MKEAVLNLQNPRKGVLFTLLITLFLLNDFANIYIANHASWLVIDYSLRMSAMGILLYYVRQRKLAWQDVGFGVFRKDYVLAGTVVLGMSSFLVDIACFYFTRDLPYQGIGSIPFVNNPSLFVFDKYIGLLLVAVSEEVILRGLALSVFTGMGINKWSTVLVSSLLFSAIHWSLSPEVMISALLLGGMFMVATMLTGSVVPAIVVHYVLDVIRYN